MEVEKDKVKKKLVKPLISEKELKTVFGMVEVLLNINTELLSGINQVISKFHYESMIGSVFLSNVEYLRAYVQFVNNYSSGLETIAKWRKDSRPISAILKKIDSAPEHSGLNIE